MQKFYIFILSLISILSTLVLLTSHSSAAEFENNDLKVSIQNTPSAQRMKIEGWMNYSNQNQYPFSGEIFGDSSFARGDAKLTIHFGRKACEMPFAIHAIKTNIFGEIEVSSSWPIVPRFGLPYGDCPVSLGSTKRNMALKPVGRLRKCIVFQLQLENSFYVAFGSENGARSRFFSTEDEANHILEVYRKNSLCY